MIKNIDAKLVFADRAYDTKEILFYSAKRSMKSVIPPTCNRLEHRDYKGFRVLKKKDSSLIVNFTVFDILSRIPFLLLSVGALLPLATPKLSML